MVAAGESVIVHAWLGSRIAVPREAIPASVVTVQLVSFVIVLGLLTPIELAVRGTLEPALLLLPVLVACLYAFVLGLSLVVAVLHAYYRDVEPILAAALLPWFFLTPIFFDADKLPGLGNAHWAGDLLQWANPVAPFVTATRDVLYAGSVPSAATLLYVLAAAALALSGGSALFRRLQGELAVVL